MQAILEPEVSSSPSLVSQLNLSECRVLLVLQSSTGPAGQVRLSNADMMELTGLSERSVRRALASLAERGIIRRSFRTSRVSIVEIVETLGKPDTAGRQPATAGRQPDTAGRQPATAGRDPATGGPPGGSRLAGSPPLSSSREELLLPKPEELDEIGVTAAQARAVASRFGPDRLQDAIKFVQATPDRRNPGGLLYRAAQGGWVASKRRGKKATRGSEISLEVVDVSCMRCGKDSRLTDVTVSGDAVRSHRCKEPVPGEGNQLLDECGGLLKVLS